MRFSIVQFLRRIAIFACLIALVAIGITLVQHASFPGAQTDPPDASTAIATLAADVKPTLVALEQARTSDGAYPLTVKDLRDRLPSGVLVDAADDGLTLDTGDGSVWVYERSSDGQGYELTRHLQDGGSLVAVDEHGRIRWLYAGSDDDDLAPVTLPP